VLEVIESLPGIEVSPATETYGYINSCPSNLGTGMRAVSTIGGQHARQISPSRRLFISEREVLATLFEGLRAHIHLQYL